MQYFIDFFHTSSGNFKSENTTLNGIDKAFVSSPAIGVAKEYDQTIVNLNRTKKVRNANRSKRETVVFSTAFLIFIF